MISVWLALLSWASQYISQHCFTCFFNLLYTDWTILIYSVVAFLRCTTKLKLGYITKNEFSSLNNLWNDNFSQNYRQYLNDNFFFSKHKISQWRKCFQIHHLTSCIFFNLVLMTNSNKGKSQYQCFPVKMSQ